MTDEHTPDAGYIKGFNEGYIITKHMPELSDCVVQVQSENPRIEGLRDGRKQLVLEKIAEQHKTPTKTEHITPDRNKDTKQEPSKDHDLEPDR
jgi:hypothetical protein